MILIVDTHVHLEFWHVGVVRSAYPPYGMQEVGSWFVPVPAVAQCYGVARLRSNQYESKFSIKIQGISFWNGLYELALTDKHIQVRFGLKMIQVCWDREFLGTTTIFQKSSIGWPQQPLTEKVLKFNMIFHDYSRKIKFFKTSI